MNEISNILTIAGISILTFLTTLFSANIRKDKSNILLALLLIALTPLFLAYNLTFKSNKQSILLISSFSSLSLSLIGPLLYEYAFHFFNANQYPLFKKWTKYLPFIILCLTISSTYVFLDEETFSYVVIASLSFSFIYLFYYVIVLIRYQLKSVKKLKEFYVKLSNKNLFWVNILIIGLFLALVLDSITGILILSTGFEGIPIINTSFLLLLVWVLGYYGLTQKRITKHIDELKKTETDQENLCETDEYKELKHQLEKALKENELFKLEDINLSILAQHLQVPTKKVSYLLNQCLNTSFYDLMNYYRLEAFKSKVEKGEIKKKTILALAFESGFNSKASFNRIFKKNEGISPNEYIKSLKNRSQSEP